MGGQNVSCDFGGGKRTIERALSKTSFGGLRKWDLPGLCRFPLRKTTGRKRTGGGKRIIGGGVQNLFFGKGFYGMFSPPLSFPPPFVFL